jgi:hypothetical protein
MEDFYTILNSLNTHFINSYFKCFIEDIKYMNEKGRNKSKDYILENFSPNICSKSELNQLSIFAVRIFKEKSYISRKDICLALLMAYYNITVIEYDDILNYRKIIKNADNIKNVLSFYMEIAGITCSIGETEYECCFSKDNITYYNFENILSSEIRRYMILGCRQIDDFV